MSKNPDAIDVVGPFGTMDRQLFWADLWRIDCAMNVTICVGVVCQP